MRGSVPGSENVSMWLHTCCSIELQLFQPTPFLLMLRPRSGVHQWVARESYVLSPNVSAVEFTDPFGNLCQRVVAPPGDFTVDTAFDIEVPEGSDLGYGAPFVPIDALPESTLPFLLPSRYCESDRFTELAGKLAGAASPGYDQCVAIVDYVRQTVCYTPGTGFEIISACEVNLRTSAVCRDMAHLAIALTRAIAIPARMVVGYLETLVPMDLHAWLEVYVGGRWYTLDPTQTHLGGGRVAIAYGRDAADVAIYTQYGEPARLVRLDVGVQRIEGPSSPFG